MQSVRRWWRGAAEYVAPAFAGVMDDKAELVIELGKDPQLSVVDHTERMKDYVVDLQIEYTKKEKDYSSLTSRST